MPFIDLGSEFGETKETPLAPEAEYDLNVFKLEHDTDNGKNNLVATIKFEGEDYAPFRHWISLPSAKDADNDAKKGHEPGTTSRMKMLMAKRFCYLFDIPYDANGFNTDDFLGARCRGQVTQDTVTSNKDNSTFNVNKLVLPRLPDEESEAA